MRFCQNFVTITRFVIFRCHFSLLMTNQGYHDVPYGRSLILSYQTSPKRWLDLEIWSKNEYLTKYKILLSSWLLNNMKTISYDLAQNFYIFRFVTKCRSQNNLVFSDTVKLIPSYGKEKNMIKKWISHKVRNPAVELAKQ